MRQAFPMPAAVGAKPAFLEAVRLRARRRACWLREQWNQAGQPSSQGLAISDSEVDRILDEPARAAAETEFDRTDPEARDLTARIVEADRAAAEEPRWRKLLAEFGLSPAESGLLALALAVENDPWWRRVCGYLHDDATASHATLWLARSLFRWTDEVRLGPGSPLVRWLMAAPLEGTGNAWAAAAPWQADPHLLAWLMDAESGDRALGAWLCPRCDVPSHCLYPDTLREMRTIALALRSERQTGLELEIVAPSGAGRRSLAGQLCASLDVNLLAVDAEALLSDTATAPALAHRAARLARLTDSAIFWHNAERADFKALRSVRGEVALTFYGVSTELPLSGESRVAHLSYTLPRLTEDERRDLWRRLGGNPNSASVEDSALLPAEMAAALQTAPAGEPALDQACRAFLRHAPGDLLTALPLPYTWQDIVLPPTLQTHLEELEQQVRLRHAVLDEWGFERLTPLGRGLSALFAGPSGTGKTMAAQVIARSLDLEIRRVDLSSVVNKYIGETEKRLKQVFDACERDKVILFFDEADALFGQRTQVKDAHDRFANIEINYLLQRMEQFDGLAILATNRKEDLDRAFLRRLRFIIDFLPPAPAERLRLWRLALHEKTPIGLELLERGIPFEKLAVELDLNGAGIKSTALRAAFLARQEGSRIGLRHILAAVRREMQKHGQVLRGAELQELQ
ncbi:MAG: ATP-binding protein [Candidatus Solibacter sp.]